MHNLGEIVGKARLKEGQRTQEKLENPTERAQISKNQPKSKKLKFEGEGHSNAFYYQKHKTRTSIGSKRF